MKRPCPVCGLKVEWEILGGRIVLFNREGNYHSCAVDKKKKGGIDKIIMAVALRAWRRDLKKLYPHKSKKQIDETIKQIQGGHL